MFPPFAGSGSEGRFLVISVSGRAFTNTELFAAATDALAVDDTDALASSNGKYDGMATPGVAFARGIANGQAGRRLLADTAGSVPLGDGPGSGISAALGRIVRRPLPVSRGRAGVAILGAVKTGTF